MPDLALLISTIRETHRTRVDFHRAEKRLTLQIKAICRRFCEGSKDEAAILYKAIKGKGEHPKAVVAGGYCLPLYTAREAVTAPRKAAEKRLEKLARELPVWPWVDSVNGFGALGLGQIIGECGDLARFDSPAKLWKRMGVGMVCVDGAWKRQQRVAGAEALAHGYSPQRRSILFVIGDSLIKKQNPYRDLYLARKEYEAANDPERKPMANHRRAQRFAEKRLLRDLWRAWRDHLQSVNHAGFVSPDGGAGRNGLDTQTQCASVPTKEAA
jgi:hypothetical protein